MASKNNAGGAPQEEVEEVWDGAYNPNLTTTSRSLGLIPEFVKAELTGDLKQIPAVGEVAEKKFKARGISTSWQLLGVLLSFKESGVSSELIVQKFWIYVNDVLQKAKIHYNQKAVIVRAMVMKANMVFPGFVDESSL